MNLRLTLAVSGIPTAIAALIALAVAVPCQAQGTAMRAEKADDAVLLARDAFRTGNSLQLARLMPQVQIFFVAAPAQMVLGFAVLAVTLPFLMLWLMGPLGSMIALSFGGAS